MNMRPINNDVKNLLDEFIADFQSILTDSLAGIYLHGSLAMGTYNPV